MTSRTQKVLQDVQRACYFSLDPCVDVLLRDRCQCVGCYVLVIDSGLLKVD